MFFTIRGKKWGYFYGKLSVILLILQFLSSNIWINHTLLKKFEGKNIMNIFKLPNLQYRKPITDKIAKWGYINNLRFAGALYIF